MDNDEKTGIRQEIEALGAVATILDALPAENAKSILVYLGGKFGVATPGPTALPTQRKFQDTSEATVAPPRSENGRIWQDFAALYDATRASNGPEKALVGGYWLQVVSGSDDFDSQTVNALLKDLGHGVGNITHAFTALIDQSPRLVMQVKKTGSTQQARKRYRLTREGMKFVEDLLNKGATNA